MKKILFVIASALIVVGMNAQTRKAHKSADAVATCRTAQAGSAGFVGAKGQKMKKSALVTDPAKVKMLNSLQTLDKDRLYIMDYTADYKLDSVLAAQPKIATEVFKVLGKYLLDAHPKSSKSMKLDPGCSTFFATEKSTGEYMLGRNFDYCHNENGHEVATTAVAVLTAPANGKKSITFIDPYFMGLKAGFYSNDTTDVSALMYAPYLGMDGMNEDGLCYGILYLDGRPAVQNAPEKPNIFATIAFRAILDRCSTVDEAIEFLRGYNMSMAMGVVDFGSFHFMLADATGAHAVVEWSFADPSHIDDTTVPNVLTVLRGNEYRYITNFYVDPALGNCEYGGLSNHGRDRYNLLKSAFDSFGYTFSNIKAKGLLQSVSQDPDIKKPTSHTQWSALYNLTDKSVELAILQEFGKWYKFKLK